MPANAIVTIGESTKHYQAQNFENLIGMKGFSDRLLRTHFKLYEGYVTNTNALNDHLHKLATEQREKTPEFAELRRRFGWEFNGMRLHEYYFGNLGGTEPLSSDSHLHQAISSSFGDFDLWKRDFLGTGAMRGIGWVICYQDPADGRLLNVWIDEHNVNHLAGGKPILVMDVFEHAFITDYGTDKASYMKSFFENIHWDVVSSRLV